jgi:hypothetical protein
MFAAGDHQHLVRADFGVTAQHDSYADDNDDGEAHDDEGDYREFAAEDLSEQ